MSTIYTQAYLDAIDKAIANNLRKVEYEDRTVVFRNVSEMMEARKHVAAQIAADAAASSGATPVPRQVRMKTNQGY
jgi:hypothetical protein